jgi:DNA-directed RNA polymerase II subunit RPB1
VYTYLRTVTAAVEIRYDPVLTAAIIPEDKVFVESFFAIPDEEIEAKVHVQSPWLLRLELDRARMIDRELTMACGQAALQKASKPIPLSFGAKTIWKSLSFGAMY